jgi:hypothetical protein
MSTGAFRGRLLVDLLVKAVLVGVLALAAAEPGWSQFHGKAIVARMITYPLVALLVPAVWWFRGRDRPFPYLIDALLVAPFTIDCLGNAANLYDTISWWDDANHFVNWALLVAAICLALERHGVTGRLNAAVGVGMGAIAAILWELAEYVTFMRHSGELRTAYTDTLGDLSLGLLGSALAAGTMRAIRSRRP